MVHPTLPHLSSEQRERLEQLADAARLRTLLYPSPKPPPVRRRSRSRQYPGGRPNPWRSVRGRRWG
ncbi:hypothetical protein PV387_34285 [Streptomyces sp. ME02-6987-2C]|jgi:hypothetical protein|uniref:hypothetical protein n=1 Tax=unclassified Streptomyces TaxID=2593676 RepID=UPI0029A32074|nr:MULTISPECIES: hypothetical protein [unclassified Streptomyces]MDX3371014.1 hypothetical protein [Streptomyces sp. ME02-6987-2C]MDX3426937.1 hypothetical protein [Streptomyces sp. ME02-6985-2c]